MVINCKSKGIKLNITCMLGKSLTVGYDLIPHIPSVVFHMSVMCRIIFLGLCFGRMQILKHIKLIFIKL